MGKNINNQQNLDQIRGILKNQLSISDEQVNYIFDSMTEIDKVIPYQLDNVISMLKSNYSMKSQQIIKILTSNPSADFFKLDNLLYKKRLLAKTIGLSAPCYKYALIYNHKAFALSDDQLEAYIFELKRDLGMNNEFVVNLLTRTYDFSHNMEDYIALAKYKMDYLYAMGITPEQIAKHPGILGNTITAISTRLIYALCNDMPIEEYLSESLFLSTEDKIHARTSAYKAGMIKKEHIYEPESMFVKLTGYKTDELKRAFPFNMHAKSRLLKEFGEKFPELSAISMEEYKKANNNIHEYKQAQDLVRYSNGEKIPESPAAIRQDILNKIKANLDEDDFSSKDDDIIIKNYDRLISMGYDSDEVIKYPNALLLTSDKLMWRTKLAKINGLSNHKFLTKGYKFKETTIFPRTCGVKIINPQTDTTCLQVYHTEPTFFRAFGESTEKLAERFKLNEAGRNLIEKLYLQAVNAETTQDENE